jgi:hypothetical protein
MIDTRFSRGEMLSFLRQSDCFVSLHRSEGFGLGMAEAMAFGKPVIGTDYSGSTEFLTESTGFPVSFSLRPVQLGEYIFADGQSWAEPDEAAAAEAMRRVFYDPQERHRRAIAGKALVEARYGRTNVGRMAPVKQRNGAAPRSWWGGRGFVARQRGAWISGLYATTLFPFGVRRCGHSSGVQAPACGSRHQPPR